MFILILACIFHHYALVNPALIATGKIEQCINENDNDSIDSLECETKVVITLSLTNNQGQVESLSTTTLTEIEDQNGEIRQLSNPWSIKLSKSDVFIRYPLSYIQTFNAKPTEIVVSTDSNMFGLNGCVDDPALNPTCGWARDVQGNIIEDSQGFCCSCSAFGTDTIRGLDGQCSMFGNDIETAHCLSFQGNNVWYSAYELNSAETYFEIIITVYRQDVETEEMIQETIILSPSNTGGVSNDGKLIAKLIGDLASYTATLSLNNYYFFVPSSPSNHQRVSNWLENSMLIEKSKVTLDGRECDKIGVSYYAFRYQSDKCTKSKGTCLNNQLEDYHINGENFAKDKVSNMVMLQNQETNQIYFSFIQDIIATSLVTLAISTDNIQFIINRVDGHIDNCQINNFESLTDNGYLRCLIFNDGTIESMFRLSIINCTNGIIPIQNKQFTVNPHLYPNGYNFTFNIHSQNILTSNHECNVILYDSLENIIDQKNIQFTSYQQTENRGNQEGYGQNTGSSSTGTAAEYSCESYCNSWYDIPCFVLKGCWEAIGKFIIILILIFAFTPWFIRFVFKRIKSSLNGDRSKSFVEYDAVVPERRRRKRKRSKKRGERDESHSKHRHKSKSKKRSKSRHKHKRKQKRSRSKRHKKEYVVLSPTDLQRSDDEEKSPKRILQDHPYLHD